MLERVPLSDGWQVSLTEHQGGSPPPSAAGRGQRIAAQVPGDVHLDLIAAGRLPADLFRGDELDHADWIEDADVWYTRTFYAPPVAEGRRVLLVRLARRRRDWKIGKHAPAP
jgi:beta-galactosidase/beta-glucuronidase